MPEIEDAEREKLGQDVAAMRVQRGWSKEEAARRAGVSSITWKRVEDGLRVQDAKLGRVVQALGYYLSEEGVIRQPVSLEKTPRPDDVKPEEAQDTLLYRRPDGLSDAEWDKLKAETRDYLDYLIDKAARER